MSKNSTRSGLAVAVRRLVRFFDSWVEHVGIRGMVLGVLAGLLAGGFIRLEIPFNEKLVETHVVIESDASTVGDPQKHGQSVLPDELSEIRFMEWVGASSTDDNIGEMLEVSIIVEKRNPSSLHRTETLGKRVIISGVKTLRDVTVGDIIDKLPMNLPLVEEPRQKRGDEERNDADNDTTSQIRCGVGKYHIHSQTNDQGQAPADAAPNTVK